MSMLRQTNDSLEFPLCEKYGLTVDEIARRLRMFGIAESDDSFLAAAREIIARNVADLVESFYDHILAFPELERFLWNAGAFSRLKAQLRQYLLTLGVDVGSRPYVEGRLRVGSVHDRIGIPLKGHLGAYAALQQAINRLIHAAAEGSAEALPVSAAINKVIMLDIALAVETYHVAALDRSEHLISQLEANQEQIRRLSQTDYLTGVMNRRCFVDLLEAEIQRCQRYGNSFCALMIDVDNFKSINDSHGHQAGDAVLKAIGRTLAANIRSTDRCSRWGGEEFAIQLVETDLETATVMAERIRLAVIREEIPLPNKRIMASVSIGVSEWRSEIWLKPPRS